MSDCAILCVDDEAIVLSTLREQLRRNFGDRCLFETAQNVDEAWEVIDELVADGVQILTIVSDWLMPGTRGDEFLIAVHRRFPQVVTVLLTGQADDDAIERARKEAALHACIAKPWSEQELVAAVAAGLPLEPA
jgi:CheY-like chemotaxis protein